MLFPVLKSRITRPNPKTAPRLRIEHSRAALVAGPGYGKTVAAAHWAHERNAAWLTLGSREDDPHSLLWYLRAALNVESPAVETLLKQGAWRAAADALWGELDEQALVVDDAHALQHEAAELFEYLVRFLPPRMQLLVTARKLPPGVKGLTVLDASFLALKKSELPPDVWEATRGWPLAVDWWNTHGPVNREQFLEELWNSLPKDQQQLLLRTSVLDDLQTQACKELCPELNVPAVLESLRIEGVFVQPYDGSLRVHPLFREFLQDRLKRDQALQLASHRAAAPLALRTGNVHEAVAHLWHGQDAEEAARVLSAEAQQMLQVGSYRRLSQWADTLPAELVDPVLHLSFAEAMRGIHRFQRALSEYQQAAEAGDPEVQAEAVLGVARVYVDTLQPKKAHQYLRQAFRLASPENKPEVLQLLAENHLNLGQTYQAARFRRWAQKLGGTGQDSFEIRTLLRTGQLHQARHSATQTGQGVGHRENMLILAYIEALEGQPERAESLARVSLAQAQTQGSAYGQAVAWMRLGHALQLKQHEDAELCYSTALGLAEELGAPRLKAEAWMGMALLASAGGDWSRSYNYALDALDLTREAGDEWLTAWLLLTSAIAARQGFHPDAANLLQNARSEFAKVRDRFGLVLCELWLAMDRPQALAAAAQRCRDLGYGFLLERATLFGPRSLPKLEQEEPLRIAVLGPLQVFREGQEVPHKAWKRKKARELLAYLISLRGAYVSKEQLWELLFPDSSPEAAARDLRVILHALFEVLDPGRPHNSPARCIVRRDDNYSLPWANVSLDLADFEKTLEHASDEVGLLQRAHNLVRGECLEDFPYAEWAQALKARWKDQYLRSATKLAAIYMRQGESEKALELSHQILGRDRCWEEGYRIQMRVHLDEGRQAQAAQVYDLCAETLKAELGVEPSAETEALFARCL